MIREKMWVFVLLTATVIFLAVLGAGIFPWVLHATAVAACLGCVFYRKRFSGRMGYLSLLAIAFVAVLTLTILPLPSCLDSVFGRERAHQNGLVKKTLNEATDLHLIEKSAHSFSLSRNKAGTMRIILLVISGFAAAVLSSRLPDEWKERYLKSMVIIAVVIAIAGYISQWIKPQGKNIWWFFTVPHGRPVGCFINRNHFGGFIAMLCPAAVVLCADGLSQRRFRQTIFWGSGFAVMSMATFMSLSRGAWLAYMASGFAVAILALWRRRVLMGIAIIALFACVFWSVGKLPYGELDTRLQSLIDVSQSESGRMRLSTWRDSLRIIPDYPVLGTGANGFRMVFPQYRTSTSRKSFTHAENEYVQLPVECGLPGLFLIIGLCVCVAKRWREGHVHGAISRIIALSVGGALIVVSVHAVFDFALRIPLYFIVFSSLLGLIISPCRREAGRPEEHHPRDSIRGRGRMAVPILGLILVIAMSTAGRKVYELDSSDFLQNAEAEELCRALVWSPTSWQVWYHLGRTAIIAGSPDSCRFGEYCITQATVYDPNNYRLWRELCRVRLSLDDKEGAQEAYDRLKRLRSWIKIRELEQEEQ